jgi:hypothetical protein
VHLQPLGNLLVDGAQELQKLEVPVPGQANVASVGIMAGLLV